jgi:hypothetical protein
LITWPVAGSVKTAGPVAGEGDAVGAAWVQLAVAPSKVQVSPSQLAPS